jgi:phosphoribosylaminoimidazole-succinocarboxamide synthase
MEFIESGQTRTNSYLNIINSSRLNTFLNTSIDKDSLPFISHQIGKVRDVYLFNDFVVIITTDRQSAFDRNLASVPFKGRVLNLTSKWWFEQTAHIVPNHFIASPHPNITIGKKCSVFPIEFVVRGYLTGSTSTSIWVNYNSGMRRYCGHLLPDGMVKNQKLSENLLTPTTKDEHDELISAEEIVSSGRMTLEDWSKCEKYSLELFKFSQAKALEKGFILVDTKYEFGKDSDGNIILIDELQTPDSSRYWIASSYEERLKEELEPENIDKEFLRKWYVANSNPYEDETLPEAPPDLVNELARRYILIYEVLTGNNFSFEEPEHDLTTSIKSIYSNFDRNK